MIPPEELLKPCPEVYGKWDIPMQEFKKMDVQEQVRSIVEYVSEEWLLEGKKCALKHNKLIEWHENQKESLE